MFVSFIRLVDLLTELDSSAMLFRWHWFGDVSTMDISAINRL